MTDPRSVDEAQLASALGEIDPSLRDPEAVKWMGRHMTELRQNVLKHRIRSQILWAAVVVGLIAHSAGYLLRASATNDLVGLLADLLYGLGFALWTGVVVVVIVEIIPQVKERQIMQAIDAYEAAVRNSSGNPTQQD